MVCSKGGRRGSNLRVKVSYLLGFLMAIGFAGYTCLLLDLCNACLINLLKSNFVDKKSAVHQSLVDVFVSSLLNTFFNDLRIIFLLLFMEYRSVGE